VTFAGILPEAARNARIELRPKRVLASVVICAVASFTAYVYYRHPLSPRELLDFFLYSQITLLILGGGIYCLQSIHREKELNTFDYQRITRLTPLELTLGKLFGAPCFAYFVVLCLAPITIVAAYLSGVPVLTGLEIYLLLLTGAIAWHALALLISLMAGRGTFAGGIILLLILFWMSCLSGWDSGGMLALQGFSPYFAAQLPIAVAQPGHALGELPAGRDLLFGAAVPHGLVLVVLWMSLTAWFLLAVARNIKRDPSVYEIYSPLQAFAFVLYLHLIVFAFYQWTRVYPLPVGSGSSLHYDLREFAVASMQAEHEFLGVSFLFFAVFALVLLRNRERVRHRILKLGHDAVSWWSAVWPAPYLLGGIVAEGLVMVALIRHKLHPETGWSFGMAFFEVCFLAAWIVRDAIYLQWMRLRRGRRSLIGGLLYLIVFYVCTSALWATFAVHGSESVNTARLAPYLVPWAIFGFDFHGWVASAKMWIGALAVLGSEALVFAALQRAQLKRLRDSMTV
jgi:hypothetical protein